MNILKGVEFWKKFLSRKFLLAVAVFLFGLLNVLNPELPNTIPWVIVGPIIAFICGEAGRDIVRDYLNYKRDVEKELM